MVLIGVEEPELGVWWGEGVDWGVEKVQVGGEGRWRGKFVTLGGSKWDGGGG